MGLQNIIGTLIFLFLALTSWAQETYMPDNSIVVIEDGNELQNPWAGGLNSPQINFVDINDDGYKDYIILERTSGYVRVFMGLGKSKFEHDINIENEFPEVTGWLLLRDLNNDELPDIVTSHPLGIKAYINTSKSSNNPTWRPYNNLKVFESFNGYNDINIKVEENDIPSIDDIDGDGDLDIINFKFLGNTLEYHKNISPSKDTLIFEIVTDQWGDFSECSCGTYAFDDQQCDLEGGRTEHSASRALLTLDYDGDGDKDIAISEESCPQIFLLKNIGDSENAILREPTNTFPNTLDPALLNSYPITTASYDEDGQISDLFITTNDIRNIGFYIDYNNSIWHYTNYPNEGLTFSLEKKNHLIDKMIDIGENGKPTFTDIDNDGDFDLILSEFGKNSSQGLIANLKYYENIGDVYQPIFELRNNFWNAHLFDGLYNIKPQFTDINNDEFIDLVFTATSRLTFETSLFFVLNNSYWSVDFSSKKPTKTSVNLQYQENFLVEDFNNDGFKDLIIGKSVGNIEYYENGKSFDEALFQKNSNTFLNYGIDTNNAFAAFSSGDIDGDSEDELLVVLRNGNVLYYDLTNLQNPMPLVIESREMEVSLTNSGLMPEIVNLFNEDRSAIVIGTKQGGLLLLRNKEAVALNSNELAVEPTYVRKQNELLKTLGNRRYEYEILSVNGQRLTPLIKSTTTKNLDVSGLATGLYLMRIYTSENTYIIKKIFISY